jgi:succinoglycan biosynthesis protein ExoV
MKLYFYKGKKNFGDSLNLWLWEKLMPGTLDNDERVAFVGIGTLLNDLLPQKTPRATQRVIFGTGVGYGNSILKLDESYKIYCLRGPLSAQALGCKDELGITDGAALIRRVFISTLPKKYQFSYMPHHQLAGTGWAQVCQELGFGYIDSRWDVEEVLSLLSQTEVVLAEAMHGAIVADALRIPWVPVSTNSDILAFKWQDWCASVRVAYQPSYMETLYHPSSKQDCLTPIRLVRDRLRQKNAMLALKKIATSRIPILSRDSCIETRTHQLEEKFYQFQLDVERGLFVM